MIWAILLILIPRVLTMNTISARGHSILWRKYGLNDPSSATVIKAETSYSSPPQVKNEYSALCSPLPPCSSSPEWVANAANQDTPKSMQSEPLEERHESPPVITLEECLEEKANIDRVLVERAKLHPFLIESTERPVVDNMNVLKESVESIRSQLPRSSKNHFYDNIETIKQDYRCYGLNHIDVIAIRLYTSSMAFVVNEALRNYSLYDMSIPTTFLPYIYALLNGLIKLDQDRQMNEACGIETEPREVTRYIPVLERAQRNMIQTILDAHQPGTYVMYPSFTSSSMQDLAKALWTDGFECRFEIKATTAIPVQDISINPNEFEAIFLPGTVFHILERDGPDIVMEEIVLQKLEARRAELPC